MKDAVARPVRARALASALVILGGTALIACIDAPEFRQVDTSATEPVPAPSATSSGDAASAPSTPARSDDEDDDDDDDKPTTPSSPGPAGPPAADAGALCGGKVCKADQTCCENKCKGGPKC